MKILVTGFGPFPGTPRNATAEIVEGLQVPGADVRAIVLPVAWNRAPAIALAAARDFDARLIVMCGVASPTGKLRVECGATHRSSDTADAEGNRIDERSGEAVRMTLDIRAAVRAARHAIHERAAIFGDVLPGARIAPVRDVNNYVCNHLAFHVRTANVAPCGFLHWPSALEGDQIAAARQVLAEIVRSQLATASSSADEFDNII